MPAKADAQGLFRAAVIDCGTSAVRASIVEISGSAHKVLEDLEYPVDLTSGLLEGRLNRPAIEGVLRALSGIFEACKANAVTRMRAVGTSALREAENADFLVERVIRASNIELEVLDSAEEARIYCSALRELVKAEKHKLKGISLFMDVGAGSTSTSIMRRGKLVHSVDEHFGTARVYELFKKLRDSVDYTDAVDRYIYGAVKMTLGRLPRQRLGDILVTGADVRHLLHLLRPEAKNRLEPLGLKQVEEWYGKVCTLTPNERASACGMSVVQAALLLPAASLIRHLCVETKHDHVLITRMTLRDGLIADLKPGGQGPHFMGRSELIAAAKQLASRYRMELPYAENTASLALQIFDQTAALHGLSERERALLEFAALVHDVGAFVNVRNRHKHSLYIVQSSDISGLTPLEKSIVAHVARYHRRSAPKESHIEFMALPRHARVVITYLASLLRIAYALDVERMRRIRKVRCEVSGERLLIHVDRRQIELERWSLKKKAKLFQELFGLNVELVPKEE
jgi:exopolyphosphatase/guanosine-5'-triphosphate,3'-diphosphate pyrophosphatase